MAYSLQEYPAAVGYDLASGLGSVDAAVLVNNWNSVTFQGTTTTLQVSPTTAAHGNAVSFTVDVKPSSGSGTPQGDVSILTDSTTPLSQGAGKLTLGSDGTATGTLVNLLGGTYHVWVQYAGDGTYGSSKSATQVVTITPAGSTLSLNGFNILNDIFVAPTAVCQPIIGPDQSLGGTEWAAAQ